MSLADALSVPESEPAHRPRWEATTPFGKSSDIVVPLAAVPEEAKWRSEIKRVTGLDIPPERKVDLAQVRYWGNPDDPMIYCRFTIEGRGGTLDIEDLVKVAKKAKRKPAPHGTDRSLIVNWADLQAGKVGSRGDSGDLVDRVMAKLDLMDAHAKTVKADTAYLLDVGDCVESFEQVASQGFTNDLSFPEQLRLARRLYTEAALRLAKTHSRVVCASVPSNHGRWRRGKGALGRPGDDFGLETLTAVHDAFALNPALSHVEFVIPSVWEETIALNVHGQIVAVAHGHQANRPDGVPLWWAKQVHGGQPSSDADLLITGHFHHVRVQTTGRSVHTGKAKWWIQCPTLDNGSDWYRLTGGDDSDPGLLCFTVDSSGWSGLQIL